MRRVSLVPYRLATHPCSVVLCQCAPTSSHAPPSTSAHSGSVTEGTEAAQQAAGTFVFNQRRDRGGLENWTCTFCQYFNFVGTHCYECGEEAENKTQQSAAPDSVSLTVPAAAQSANRSAPPPEPEFIDRSSFFPRAPPKGGRGGYGGGRGGYGNKNAAKPYTPYPGAYVGTAAAAKPQAAPGQPAPLGGVAARTPAGTTPAPQKTPSPLQQPQSQAASTPSTVASKAPLATPQPAPPAAPPSTAPPPPSTATSPTPSPTSKPKTFQVKVVKFGVKK